MKTVKIKMPFGAESKMIFRVPYHAHRQHKYINPDELMGKIFDEIDAELYGYMQMNPRTIITGLRWDIQTPTYDPETDDAPTHDTLFFDPPNILFYIHPKTVIEKTIYQMIETYEIDYAINLQPYQIQLSGKESELLLFMSNNNIKNHNEA